MIYLWYFIILKKWEKDKVFFNIILIYSYAYFFFNDKESLYINVIRTD